MGLEISQEVMETIITRMTGKSVKDLLADKTVVNSMVDIMPDEFYFPKANVQCQKKFIRLHSLLHIILDEKYHPKSEWGNPVVEEDTGIGDDIERFNRICFIVCGISDRNPETVSVESYIKLLDIMVKSLIRLDPEAKFKEKLKSFATGITSFKTTLIIDKKYSNLHSIGNLKKGSFDFTNKCV